MGADGTCGHARSGLLDVPYLLAESLQNQTVDLSFASLRGSVLPSLPRTSDLPTAKARRRQRGQPQACPHALTGLEQLSADTQRKRLNIRRDGARAALSHRTEKTPVFHRESLF
ncbi:hypothetical protein AAFF_G00217470 [Aldrovandia affinis]|uniref:Uncharacterized protein n=1 Tax=Aldrovandia affinis TaxID=143900 RepID=A0AAD7SW18_9TELE|nr:hypothetical protein AAFF_G00217470 [Aldrovandia affinis]